MFWINEEKNKIIFDTTEFNEDLNYLPLLVEALTKMDRDKCIYFGIDLDKTPVVFVFYIAKVQKEAQAKIKMYFKEDNEELRNGLASVDIKYRNITEFPKE